jgi:2-oxoglutarate/2-oxoacid ferredoxin oxidoreductase subunit alpha
MPAREITLAMVGSGGDGVVTMGDMLSQAAAKDGLNVIKTEAYGPQIRGGEASCTVRVSGEPIAAQGDLVDVLVVFNWADFKRFQGEIGLAKDAVVLYEASDATPAGERGAGETEGSQWVPVPFLGLAVEASGMKAAKNITTLGILAEVFGFPKASLRRAIEHRFLKKKGPVQEANLKAFDGGIAWGKALDRDLTYKRLKYVPGEPKLLMSGNEATAVAALHAGCRFFAGYPITPSSEVLHFLSEWMPKVGGSVVQTEDELSAYGAVIGASFAGVKSMTATSGPGLSLMTEMLGLSSIAEIPSVIVNVQRGGPSTGLPTKSEQSDLFQAVFGSHGDAPRVVLSCEDVESSFHATVDAFNIAEEYQVPVIVLSDQSIAQRRETLSLSTLQHEVKQRRVPTSEEIKDYRRYIETPSGVSPMSRPGTKDGVYQTNGLEHNEAGSPDSMFLTHEKMNAKRYRKLRPIRDQYHGFLRYGVEGAAVGILCWGSSKGPVKEAVLRAVARGEKIAAFVPQVLYPFPKKQFEAFLAGVDEVLVIEVSFAAQFYKYLRTFLDLPEGRTHIFKRSGGKNLEVVEVEEEIRKVLAIVSSKTEVLV